MSSSTETSATSSPGKGAGFTFVLGAFAAFAVIFAVIQSWQGGPAVDPRAGERLTNTAEIKKGQDALLTQMGLSDKEKTASVFAKTVDSLKAKTPGPSAVMIPGSPTQLKFAPVAAPAPAEKTPPASPAKK
ncbi:MAG: hypothetical protein K1X78_01260 [Verrucomicrobiaceae bacterium]|nr:hypothetical protein [Verrucomicrobiaceae bacterium]